MEIATGLWHSHKWCWTCAWFLRTNFSHRIKILFHRVKILNIFEFSKFCWLLFSFLYLIRFQKFIYDAELYPFLVWNLFQYLFVIKEYVIEFTWLQNGCNFGRKHLLLPFGSLFEKKTRTLCLLEISWKKMLLLAHHLKKLQKNTFKIPETWCKPIRSLFSDSAIGNDSETA